MKASIVIRSKNEERFIGEVLQRVLAQEFSASYEIIVLDSGSQDRTLEIVRGFPVRLEMLPSEKFTFGFALNYGATLAQGDYIVFLSAHCLPRERSWLRELTLPLETNSCVAATYGRQEPLKGINPFEEIELERVYALQAGGRVRAPFSNANSAVRREILRRYPFDEVITGGEDFLWAHLLPPLHTIQYVPTSSVFHSHPPLLRYWRRRWYIEGLMVLYLAQLHDVPDPWADSQEENRSRFKWHVLKRMGTDMQLLWQRRAFGALCRYPLYELNRVYFYRKGKRDGAYRYRRRTSPCAVLTTEGGGRPTSMDLSIIIVSWNCKAELLDCIESIENHACSGVQDLIVVDNASTDGTADAIRRNFPRVRLLENERNLGFASAVNRGLRDAQGDYLLFLNPDTIVPAGALDAALQALRDRPERGILGVRLRNSDGSPQPSCGRFLSLGGLVQANVRRMTNGEPSLEERVGGLPLWTSTTSEEVDWVIGAFMLCRRTILMEVGGFDEDYFLYAEDMDLCYRVRQRGYAVWYDATISVLHHGNRSGARKWAERREGEIVRAELVFLRKHLGRFAALGFRFLGGGLFLWKGISAWLWADGRQQDQQIKARRYWYMTKVCLGWE